MGGGTPNVSAYTGASDVSLSIGNGRLSPVRYQSAATWTTILLTGALVLAVSRCVTRSGPAARYSARPYRSSAASRFWSSNTSEARIFSTGVNSRSRRTCLARLRTGQYGDSSPSCGM